MKAISVKEARQKFAQLIETAQRGTPITITRRGRKVAELIGAAGEVQGKLPDLTAFRSSLKGGRKGKRTTIDDLRQSERA
jgi:prevent-host-death family protein